MGSDGDGGGGVMVGIRKFGSWSRGQYSTVTKSMLQRSPERIWTNESELATARKRDWTQWMDLPFGQPELSVFSVKYTVLDECIGNLIIAHAEEAIELAVTASERTVSTFWCRWSWPIWRAIG